MMPSAGFGVEWRNHGYTVGWRFHDFGGADDEPDLAFIRAMVGDVDSADVAQSPSGAARPPLDVETSGTLTIKAGVFSDTPRITKAMRIEASGGTVTIGQ